MKHSLCRPATSVLQPWILSSQGSVEPATTLWELRNSSHSLPRFPQTPPPLPKTGRAKHQAALCTKKGKTFLPRAPSTLCAKPVQTLINDFKSMPKRVSSAALPQIPQTTWNNEAWSDTSFWKLGLNLECSKSKYAFSPALLITSNHWSWKDSFKSLIFSTDVGQPNMVGAGPWGKLMATCQSLLLPLGSPYKLFLSSRAHQYKVPQLHCGQGHQHCSKLASCSQSSPWTVSVIAPAPSLTARQLQQESDTQERTEPT